MAQGRSLYPANTWDFSRRAQDWEVLRPWAAWPVLAAYGAPVLALAFVLGWLVAQTRIADGSQALARRQAAADARMQEAEGIRREGEAVKQEARAALENAARREQEADARIEAAEFRLQRFGRDQHRPAAADSEAERPRRIGYNGPLLKTPIPFLIQGSFHGVSFLKKGPGPFSTTLSTRCSQKTAGRHPPESMQRPRPSEASSFPGARSEFNGMATRRGPQDGSQAVFAVGSGYIGRVSVNPADPRLWRLSFRCRA